MSDYNTLEVSRFSASPFELFHFEHGAVSYAYTSGDAAVSYSGRTYQPEALSRSEVDQSDEDWAGGITVTLPVDNPVAQLFAAYLPSSQVYLTVLRAHRSGTGYVVAFAGTVASASFEEGACSLTCQPVGALLSKQVPTMLFQGQCSHALFSQTKYYGAGGVVTGSAQSVGCNVKREAYRVGAELSAVSGLTVKSPAFATKPDGWFTYGHIVLPGGEVRFITAHTGDTLTLSYPINATAGVTIGAYPGCNGSESTCRTKFNNVINFNGHTRMPGRNPFTTAIV